MEDDDLVKVRSLLSKGILERETGDLVNAGALFKEALEILRILPDSSDTRLLKLKVNNHFGLNYFHQGNYDEAKEIWEKCKFLADIWHFPTEKAVALRQLSRKEYCQNLKDFETAVDMAEMARFEAANYERPDLVWFTHGLFSAKHAHMKSQKREDYEVLEEILKIEKNDLIKVWRITPKLQRNVWLGGLLMDYAIVYNKVSIPILKTARFLVKLINLKRREEQITKRIEDID